MIPLFIPSYNRAVQLNALFDSLELNAPNLFHPCVLVKVSNDFYKEGYKRLDNKRFSFPVTMKLEEDLIGELKLFFQQSGENVVGIATDDSLLYRGFSYTGDDIVGLFAPDVLSVSLRLGLNCVLQDYRTGRKQRPLTNYTSPKAGFVKWSFKDYWPYNNYGYPVSMDFALYRANDLAPHVLNYNGSFRGLEAKLSHHDYRRSYQKCYMVSPENSVALNIPANAVQMPPLHWSEKCFINVYELNKRYLAGEKINVEDMDFSEVNGCHQEIPYRFIYE